ncbi:MAG: hypothetical protein UR66_C0009G0039 [Candidatus Moranbacteria bacterium GW2011_GWE1_35_17]|nr:MAG: hypothetical protein UR66_C0009G0039 [Candidatus Moranbacteria bacterium GW2011_GWE1_35_17]KKP68150.1 MAG: hypothetical protein UR65_C0062G0006 [Candidatus Moranbacteria bacterium GW2011_GWE2_35_164]KKP82719.1 MAG: hypothetical protein UR82_C0034G0015 [Candidatus Moranbacteria bacterium GW2011_GWF1_35_5]KKP84059.1 MAG: hypothetical protein UR83_C0028G0015 [Candidatus Moranbacteria bacterium GW2011_GWF2_35_54]
MGKKKIKLRKRDAERIAEFAAALTKELGIFGRIAVSNCKQQVMAEKKVGSPYPVTRSIAVNKANQSAYTGMRTRITAEVVLSGKRTLGLYGIDPEKFVPFAGGCPIYTQEGIHIGGAGFSQETAVTDERIIATAIEACGFLSDAPKKEDISLEKIQKAAKKVKKRMKKGK